MDEQKRPRAWVYARIPGDYDGTMNSYKVCSKHPNVKYTPDAGGEPYVIPPDYMGDAVTITMDAVAAATAPEITEEMYEQLDYLEKHPEENYYENEENFSQYDQGD